MPKANLNYEQELAEYDIDLRENPRSPGRTWFESGGWLPMTGVTLLLVLVFLDFLMSKMDVEVPGAVFVIVIAGLVMTGLAAMQPKTDLRAELRRRHADGWQACGDCRGRGRSIEVDPLVPPFCEARREDVRIEVCPTCHGYRWVKTTGEIADDEQGDPTS